MSPRTPIASDGPLEQRPRPGLVERLVEAAPVGMSVHDADGRCLVINQRLAEINGIEADDAIGRTVDDYLPSLASDLRPVLDRVVRTGMEVRTEIDGETPAAPGRRRRWRTAFRPIDLDDGTTGVAVTVEELADADQLELDRREHTVRDVLERIDEAFCVCEMILDGDRAVDYRFLDVNPLFEQMTGLANAIGRTALELVPDLEQHWIDTYARVALDGDTVRFQQESVAMGRWFDVFATPMPEPGRFALVFRDDTARRKAEKEAAATAELYRSLADDLPLIVWLHGPDGEQQFVNQTFCEYFGVDRSDMHSDRWQVLLHPDDEPGYVASFAHAVTEQTEFHDQVRVRDREGRWRWLESWGRPRFGPDGAYLGHIGSSADVTDRVAAESQVAEASSFLRNVLDSLFSFVGVLEPDGTLIEANRAPLDAAGLSPEDVLGRKFWDAAWWTHDDDVRNTLRSNVARAAAGEMVRYDVPVRVAGDQRLWIDFQLVPLRDADGNVTHIIPSGLDISERIEADRARSTLLTTEQQRRRHAELLEDHAAALASALGPGGVAATTVEHVERHLGIRVAALDLRRNETVEAIGGPAFSEIDDHRDLHLDEPYPGLTAIRTGEPIRCGTRDEIVERFPAVVDLIDRLHVTCLVALPLRAGDRRVVGALIVGSDDPDDFDDTTLSIVEGFAEQAGLALDRALLHESVVDAHRREHQIAVRLQQALLPDRLVDHDDAEIAATYRAAGEHLDVGGDWYDSFTWPSGEIGIMVGDVVGHDLEATAAMGRIRAAVAALVPTLPPDPKIVLEALQRVAHGPDGTSFVTAACAILDPHTATVRCLGAGHPPALLVRDGSAALDAVATAPPLGAFDVALPDATTHRMAPGDAVVLYSDGLVERRGDSIDTGLARLRAAADELDLDDLDSAVDALAERIAGDTADDDLVIVALRWRPR